MQEVFLPGHGNNPKDMLTRLETMTLMAADLPLPAVRGQIASAIDILVHLGRLRDKSRKVLEIVEIGGCVDGEIQINPLYRFEEEGGGRHEVCGRLKKVGELRYVEKLRAAGYTL